MRYSTHQNGPNGGLRWIEFWVSSNSGMNVRNSFIVNSRWKKWVIYLVPMFPSWAMVLKLSKKVYILQFCADLSNKCKSVREIYIYASERSRYSQMVVYHEWWLRPYHFLKECNETLQMQYVNCFNRLRFLAEVSAKL